MVAIKEMILVKINKIIILAIMNGNDDTLMMVEVMVVVVTDLQFSIRPKSKLNWEKKNKKVSKTWINVFKNEKSSIIFWRAIMKSL